MENVCIAGAFLTKRQGQRTQTGFDRMVSLGGGAKTFVKLVFSFSRSASLAPPGPPTLQPLLLVLRLQQLVDNDVSVSFNHYLSPGKGFHYRTVCALPNEIRQTLRRMRQWK